MKSRKNDTSIRLDKTVISDKEKSIRSLYKAMNKEHKGNGNIILNRDDKKITIKISREHM